MNTNNTDKKRQHYVPKFYLRNFSVEGNGKQIGIFNTNQELYIQNGALAKQAYMPFFYGKDGKIEDLLSLQEGEASSVIREIINTGKLPLYNSLEYKILLLFVILTASRNPRSCRSPLNAWT